jgi:hypothetical protein
VLEVKQTYNVQYNKGEYKHAVILVADNYKHAVEKFEKAFKDAHITNISFAGPVCL